MALENQVVEFDSFRVENLNYADYMNTLAAESLRVGMYTEKDIDKIRLGLMDTLAVVIGYHSGGESSSVRTETARGFLHCIQYNCDTYLKSLKDDKTAAEILKSLKVEEIYNRGYVINKKNLEECRRIYENVKYTRLSQAPESYNRAIDVRIPHYLESYDPRFNAQDKLYVTIPTYRIKGPFRIDGTLTMLQTLHSINNGKVSDIVL